MFDEKEYLSIPGHVPIKEAAEMLGISEDRIYQHVQNKRLPGKKVGGRYMIPLKAVEAFKLNPPGRVRANPPEWRIYHTRIRLLSTDIHVQIRPGQLAAFEVRIVEMRDLQRHLFTGTMERHIFRRIEFPDQVLISLLWKDNEMPDQRTQQQDLAAFQADFADLLDWDTARIETYEGMLYT